MWFWVVRFSIRDASSSGGTSSQMNDGWNRLVMMSHSTLDMEPRMGKDFKPVVYPMISVVGWNGFLRFA